MQAYNECLFVCVGRGGDASMCVCVCVCVRVCVCNRDDTARHNSQSISPPLVVGRHHPQSLLSFKVQYSRFKVQHSRFKV